MSVGSSPEQSTIHGSAVATGGRAVLILGAAGVGKTTLALEMVALGAGLVGDDRVVVTAGGSGGLTVDAAPGLAGLAEVRGFGLIRLPPHGPASLGLVADLDREEPERLPSRRYLDLSGVACPAMLCKGRTGLAAALTCILRSADWPDPETFSLHPAKYGNPAARG